MPRRIMVRFSLGLAAGLILATPLAADVLKVPGGSAAVLVLNNTPGRGLTQAQVREQYGDPVSTRTAIGDPPISSWDYPEYTIYFEHHLVLHAVVHNEEGDESP